MKRVFLILAAVVLLLSSSLAEEELIEEIMLDDLFPETEEAGIPYDSAPAADTVVYTPSYGSPYSSDTGNSPYWTLPMDISDVSAVWNMLMAPITVVSLKKSTQKTQTYLYREPDESSKKIGVVTCESQGVRVIDTLDNGWSLVECYSSSFHATKVEAWNLLVSGYIKTEYLKEITPSPSLGLVVDKLTQRLYVFKDGQLLSTLLCSTGLTMWNGSKYQPYNETRSGEFLLMSKVGRLISDSLYCENAIRFNSGDMIHEVPHINNADGSRNYERTERKLGTKCSHGCIRVQRNKTPEGINMNWIYNSLKSNSLVKIVIWEDWQGRQIAVPDANTVLYYNPKKGNYYHSAEKCYSAKNITFTPFLYSQLEDSGFAGLKRCPYCCPVLRTGEIEVINSTYAAGGDHDELLTSLRQGYYDYLAAD